MPLDYSKWDKLELSDDEDFECHPNVDKKSMIRWKQAKIHQERRERKDRIASYKLLIEAYQKYLLILKSGDVWAEKCKDIDIALILSVRELINKERDARWEPPPAIGPLFDERITLETIVSNWGNLDVSSRTQQIQNTIDSINFSHKLIDAEIDRLEKESSQKLTADQMIVGFDKTAVAPKKQFIETIHTPSSHDVKSSEVVKEISSHIDEDEDRITYPPALEFSALDHIDASFAYLGKHPELANQNYSDQVLAEAFRKEMTGEKLCAQKCVHQALLLQYCGLLGKDGISLFFARMRTHDHKGQAMFLQDVDDTYSRISNRVAEILGEEEKREKEENERKISRLEALKQPDGTICFPILEESTQEEQARALFFNQLDRSFQEALLLEDVDKINVHLAQMSKEDAELLVQNCDEYGLLTLSTEE